MPFKTVKRKKYLKDTTTAPKKKTVKLVLLGLGIVVLFTISVMVVKNIGRQSATGVISKITGAPSLAAANGQTNILILGLDRRGKQSTESGWLTDTIMVGSINETGTKAFIISLPRDLWVPYADSPYSGKINAVYQWGGVEALEKTIENILDLPIHYYAVVGFEGFVKAVDTVGGLTVDIAHEFDDYKYPVEGRENVYPEEDRYTHVYFSAGEQTLSGEKALQFVRSRHALGDEGTDFARSARQQKVILAFKDRLLSHKTLFNPAKIKLLYDIFKEYVETNVSLEEALAFYDLAQSSDNAQISKQVLDGNLFYNPKETEPYNGAWVLIPKAGDFSAVQEFIKDL